jgi:hypothetical protein
MADKLPELNLSRSLLGTWLRGRANPPRKKGDEYHDYESLQHGVFLLSVCIVKQVFNEVK